MVLHFFLLVTPQQVDIFSFRDQNCFPQRLKYKSIYFLFLNLSSIRIGKDFLLYRLLSLSSDSYVAEKYVLVRLLTYYCKKLTEIYVEYIILKYKSYFKLKT